jgi:hypothetical protein
VCPENVTPSSSPLDFSCISMHEVRVNKNAGWGVGSHTPSCYFNRCQALAIWLVQIPALQMQKATSYPHCTAWASDAQVAVGHVQCSI